MDNSSSSSNSAVRAVDAWADAIRAKPGWTAKVLDDARNLVAKWVEEGDLGRFGTQQDEIDRTVRELKAEAARIRAFDNWTFLASGGSTVEACDNQLLASSQLKEDVKLALAGSGAAIKTPVLRDNCGVRTAHGLVPKSVHELLTSELDKLQAQAPAADYHPGSDGKVLDVVHPSIYPYVADRTRLVSGEGPAEGLFKTTTELQIYSEYGEVPAPVPHSSTFAWLPSVFRIDDEGHAKILGYVNNLGPRSSHPGLYAALEHVFTLALPLVEQSFNAPYERVLTEGYQRWKERHAFRTDPSIGGARQLTPEAWFEFVKQQREKTRAGGFERKLDENQPKWEGMRGPVSLKGKDVKVIVKVAEYHLKPGQKYEGSWHIEGAPHEMIGSSLIYYYDTSPEIKDKGLSLRRVRIEGDKPDEEEEHANEDYGVYFEDADGEWIDPDEWEGDQALPEMDVPSDWGSNFDPYNYNGSVPLGTVEATGGADAAETGRMLCFPNWVQHCVAGLENAAEVKEGEVGVVAKRKILCFFVVREDRDEGNNDKLTLPGLTYTGLSSLPPVITTLQVPPQQHHLSYPSTAFWLARASAKLTGTPLPTELCERIFALSGTGFSREEAERYRREVMADRRILVKNEGEAWEAEFGLCEH